MTLTGETGEASEVTSRTYYMYAETKVEADEWVRAIKTNIEAVVSTEAQAERVVQWYRKALGCTSSGPEVVRPLLDVFYDAIITSLKHRKEHAV